MSFPGGSNREEFACNAGETGFDPWVGKMPWRRKWLLIPVFFLGEFHGQRSLVGYSPWGHIESDMTERLTLNTWQLYGYAIYLFIYYVHICMCSIHKIARFSSSLPKSQDLPF